ncbi:MAG: peptidyl-prolyl cis-trans isomerase, partial [Betaproteobacteria bacterium]|nr:peptidyl-prolyl cis-trans isomerase [Betaproteobacteria bacterium]
MKTSLGEITVELNPSAAPITVRNFLDYVNDSFYNNTIIHRIEKGFVAQGGWLDLTPAIKNPTRAAITLESNNGLSNLKGTIGMARTNEPNSATTQFYFNLADNTGLDYAQGVRDGYAVFG